MDTRTVVPVRSVLEENESHTTLEVDICTKVLPGQFFMLTDYEHGEKPFSVSRIRNGRISFTIKKTGDFSRHLCAMQPGDLISLRGPYGNGFPVRECYHKRVLMVGGGCGTAPLRALVDSICAVSDIDFVNGARSAGELLFPAGIAGVSRQFDCTDDGTAGERGTVLDLYSRHLLFADYDVILASGPEMMLTAFINSLDGITVPSFFLIERYMKCAIGICGQCSIDPEGVRVCVEGPVFPREKLCMLSEFGRYARNAAGNRKYW